MNISGECVLPSSTHFLYLSTFFSGPCSFHVKQVHFHALLRIHAPLLLLDYKSLRLQAQNILGSEIGHNAHRRLLYRLMTVHVLQQE